METRADEMLGQVSGNEYDLLLSKLAGARGNRVFPSSASKPLNALPKLFSLFRKRGEKLEAPMAPLPHLRRKNRKRGALALAKRNTRTF